MFRNSLLGLLSLALSGCLFLGDVNQHPTASVTEDQTTTTLGVPITLTVTVSDDQARPTFTSLVRDETGAEVTDPCTLELSKSDDSFPDSATLSLTIWRAGTYTVEVTPVDHYGATGSPSTVQLSVTDQAPVFVDATKQLGTGNPPDACGDDYTALVPILVTLRDAAFDPDASHATMNPKCAPPAPLRYSWTIGNQPTGAGKLGLPVQGLCPAVAAGQVTESTDATVVCLYADPSLPSTTPGMYTVELRIDDGVHIVAADGLMIPIIGASPACLDGVFPAAGNYVLSRDEPTIFQAVGVDDVSVPGSLAYVWSLKRAGESDYTVIVAAQTGDDGGARLVLDPVGYGFAVGDDVELRVEVVDANAHDLACPVDDEVCTADSCAAAPAATCPRRATWGLEYR